MNSEIYTVLFNHQILVRTRFSTPKQTSPGGPLILLYNGCWVFPRGKAAGAWHWPPTHI